MMDMMGSAQEGHEGYHGMMQQCMDMMSSMIGGTMDTNVMSSMGLDLPLSLLVALILVWGLGYMLGARRFRAQG